MAKDNGDQIDLLKSPDEYLRDASVPSKDKQVWDHNDTEKAAVLLVRKFFDENLKHWVTTKEDSDYFLAIMAKAMATSFPKPKQKKPPSEKQKAAWAKAKTRMQKKWDTDWKDRKKATSAGKKKASSKKASQGS
tara:strand:+ start:76 stop:477 length:402 start_codon:yes stop_codon:yes gene_type:complete